MQGFVTQMGQRLLTTGPDADCSSIASLEELRQHYCCLHALKARVAPRWWRRLMTGNELWTATGQTGQMPRVPDWAELTVMPLSPASALTWAHVSHPRTAVVHADGEMPVTKLD